MDVPPVRVEEPWREGAPVMRLPAQTLAAKGGDGPPSPGLSPPRGTDVCNLVEDLMGNGKAGASTGKLWPKVVPSPIGEGWLEIPEHDEHPSQFQAGGDDQSSTDPVRWAELAATLTAAM